MVLLLMQNTVFFVLQLLSHLTSCLYMLEDVADLPPCNIQMYPHFYMPESNECQQLLHAEKMLVSCLVQACWRGRNLKAGC